MAGNEENGRFDPPLLSQMRSLLFVPGHRSRAVEKARDLPCDFVIIDLEDAVPPGAKEDARANIRVAAATFAGRPWGIRISAEGDSEHGPDMVLAREVRPHFVVLPKVSSARAAHDAYLVCQTPIVAMIETARGVLDARAIAAQNGVAALLMGANDLRHDLKVPAAAGREAISHALQAVILAARAEGRAVFDAVFNRLDDPAGFAAECRMGRALGFDGKSLIHPDQIEPANALFGPDEAELNAARELIAAYVGGAQRHDGAMVEEMHVAAARALLARSGAS